MSICWHENDRGEVWGVGRWLTFYITRGPVIKRLHMRLYDKSYRVLCRESEEEWFLMDHAEYEDYLTGLRGIGMTQQPDGEWREEPSYHGLKVWTCYNSKYKGTVSEQEDPDIPEMAWQLRINDMNDFLGVDYFATEQEAKTAFESYIVEQELSR